MQFKHRALSRYRQIFHFRADLGINFDFRGIYERIISKFMVDQKKPLSPKPVSVCAVLAAVRNDNDLDKIHNGFEAIVLSRLRCPLKSGAQTSETERISSLRCLSNPLPDQIDRIEVDAYAGKWIICLLYTSPSPRD